MMRSRFGGDVARHGAIVFGGVALASLFNYLYYMLIGRRSDIETYGEVASLASALLVLAAPATVGQLIVARLAADLESRGDPAAVRKLADVATLWTASIASVVVLIGIGWRTELAEYFHLPESTVIMVCAVSLGLLAIVTVQRGIFQGSHRFGDFAASSSIDATTRVAIGVPLVTVLGATGGMLGFTGSLALALGYNLIAFRLRYGTRRAPIALDPRLIRRVVSHVGLGQFTFTVLMFYDVPIVRHAFDARSAGLYAAAALVGRAVLATISFVPTLIMPKATARVAARMSPTPLLLTALAIAGVIVVGAAGLALFAPAFVVRLIAGGRFGDAAPLVLAYTLASGALALANVVGAYKMGLHQYDFVVPTAIVAAVEILLMAFWHPSLTSVVTVLLCGHLAVFASTLFGLTAPAATAVSSYR